MKALLIGATGATGKDLLQLLLQDNSFTQVEIFVRRQPEVSHSKLNTHVVNFDKPEQWTNLVKGDVLFSCLGTTLKAAGSKDAQWKIDYDYQYEFAKAARENGVSHYVLVSSNGANSRSLFFYTRMKGKLEEAVKALGFLRTTIFNPPILERKDTDRKGEKIAIKAIHFFNRMGILLSQSPLPTKMLAQAMVNSTRTKRTGISFLNGKEIRAIATSVIN
jgi:uncharacterized protein YbjT (DUF2867 family)